MNDSLIKNKIPIIVTAFGTTAKAFATYEKMDKVFKNSFPNNPIYWAYSSRMVKRVLNKKNNRNLKDPLEIMDDLRSQGHKWVVLQSLHLICGHEFDRLVSERESIDIRSSIGLPLLTSQPDYVATAKALDPLIAKISKNQNKCPDQAVVLVGHGTDHPAWSAYSAFEDILRQLYGSNIFTGVVEGYPEMEVTLQRIKTAGFKKVCIIPFMLVAGVHFNEDLTQEEDSWQKTFECNNIAVSVVNHGIGEIDMISGIYCQHMIDALNVIPI
ncbi:MAG: sirohydrochlorin cobaltochelatase [Desulfobacteraceae bacterium]|nr:sirohydrochlorin cobaltochelatase [Desulfobacteraceae bacterium]